MHQQLAIIPGVRLLFYLWFSISHEFRYNVLKFFKECTLYFSSIKSFKQLPANREATIKLVNLMPMLADRTSKTPVEPIYLLQDAWACNKLFGYKPKKHVDIGSYTKTVAIMSQFVPTSFVDIRPVDISLKGLTFMKGSILDLPFDSGSVESVSSLCVIEHIGLGRYGDPLDSYGSEKALTEIQRVLKKGGHLLVSVPVSAQNSVYFNAHRAFAPQYFHSLLMSCKLLSADYIYGNEIVPEFRPNSGVGVGLFHYQKLA